MYEVIVVGAGIEGSSTAYELAQRGHSVLLIEQFRLPHSHGSSHGQSRITRLAYGNQDFYTRMMKDAYKLVSKLERESGETLYRQCGLLMMGDKQDSILDGSLTSLNRFDVPHETFDITEQRMRYPNLVYPDNYRCILDKRAGILISHKMLNAYQEQFVKKGGTLKDGERLLDVTPGPIITVKTDKSTYTSRNLVLTLGPWAVKFLPRLGLNIPLKPLKITVCYWRERIPGEFSADHFPAFVDTRALGPWAIYGLPALEYEGLVKICLHHGPVVVDLESQDDTDNEWVLQALKNYVRKHFPTLEPEPENVDTCLYTNTPDEDFVLDRHPHPQLKNIVIGAGFSGHGFKLAPVVGRILADLTENKQSKYDLSHFKIGRFKLNQTGFKLSHL